MAPPEHVRHHSNLIVTHGEVVAQFYSAGDAGYFCDVFVAGVAIGEGFAYEQPQALKEALHNAVESIVKKIFRAPGDDVDTIPAPPPSEEQEP